MCKAIYAILLTLILGVVAYGVFVPLRKEAAAPAPAACHPMEEGKWYRLFFEQDRGPNIYKAVARGPGVWCRVQRADPNSPLTEPYWINVDKAISIHEVPPPELPSGQ